MTPHATPATRVVCLGETMAMATPTRTESLRTADECLLSIGGAESNVAIQLASLGFSSAWVSRVGEDPFGDRVLDQLAARGVDVSLVERDPHAPTGLYLKEPDTGRGARTLYYRAGSAASRMSLANLAGWGLDTAAWLHVSGITAGLSDDCLTLLRQALALRGSARLPTSFDVNYRPALWSVEQAAPVLGVLASQASVMLVGLDEAETLWGTPTAEAVAQRFPNVPRIVVKDADREAVEIMHDRTGERVVTRVPAESVEVVEPVGAGDAFAAGYLGGLLSGRDASERLSLGHRLAAHTLRSRHDVSPDHGVRLVGAGGDPENPAAGASDHP
ncbi:sugar kinase [Micrococcales bacterium 31B]|nr:sugar kinase [Micrococcales bacterium 31B]